MARVPGTSLRSAISIRQIMKQVIASGKVTRKDEVGFLQALVTDVDLTAEDMTMLNDLIKRLDMGLIKVVGE